MPQQTHNDEGSSGTRPGESLAALPPALARLQR